MQKQMSERDEELETVRKELQSMKVPWESERETDIFFAKDFDPQNNLADFKKT